MKAYWGSGSIAPHILDFGIRWRWVVRFTPRPLYPQRKNHRFPLDMRLGGPQSPSGRGVEEEISKSPLEFEPRSYDRPARSQSLYRLSYPGSWRYKVSLILCTNLSYYLTVEEHLSCFAVCIGDSFSSHVATFLVWTPLWVVGASWGPSCRALVLYATQMMTAWNRHPEALL
jgi:hypothetical protein